MSKLNIYLIFLGLLSCSDEGFISKRSRLSRTKEAGSKIESKEISESQELLEEEVVQGPTCEEQKDEYLANEPVTCVEDASLCQEKALKTAQIFSNNMVLQRGEGSSIWGKAYPNEFITLSIDKYETCGKADENGNFKLLFPSLKAGGPYDLNINGDEIRESVVLSNIMIGDVWISSGQSNMYWPMNLSSGGSDEVKSANSPNLRFFNVQPNKSTVQVNETRYTAGSHWNAATAEHEKALRDFSAVSYYFGKKIHSETNIPIGLINSTVPMTRIESWAPELNTSSRIPILYNGMIHPLIQMNIKGFIWYQGESNASQGLQYQSLLTKLITNWRARFNNKDLPFYFVQLSAFAGRNFTPLKIAQSKTLSSVHNTGMAVITDISTPNNVHPPNKKGVGNRLAYWALAKDYGKKEQIYSGPVPKTLTVNNTRAIITFEHVGSGLRSRDGKKLSHFEVAASKNGDFYSADTVEIRKDKLFISSSQVASPHTVRFGWGSADMPNLVNSAGLPTSVFILSK